MVHIYLRDFSTCNHTELSGTQFPEDGGKCVWVFPWSGLCNRCIKAQLQEALDTVLDLIDGLELDERELVLTSSVDELVLLMQELLVERLPEGPGELVEGSTPVVRDSRSSGSQSSSVSSQSEDEVSGSGVDAELNRLEIVTWAFEVGDAGFEDTLMHWIKAELQLSQLYDISSDARSDYRAFMHPSDL